MSNDIYRVALESLMYRFSNMFYNMEFVTSDYTEACIGILHMVNKLCTDEECQDIYDKFDTLKEWFREDRRRLKQ